MNATKKMEMIDDVRLAMDLADLSYALGCGRQTAEKIGADAHARIVIGRRVLYNLKKVQEYLDAISE